VRKQWPKRPGRLTARLRSYCWQAAACRLMPFRGHTGAYKHFLSCTAPAGKPAPTPETDERVMSLPVRLAWCVGVGIVCANAFSVKMTGEFTTVGGRKGGPFASTAMPLTSWRVV
jgi:hypothetical protein